MNEPARRTATYEDLYGIPGNMTGEILDGELFAHPRPSRKHIYTASALDSRISPPFQYREGGGPGGWVIMVEPEIGLAGNILVPDLGGWKRERLPVEEETNWISVAPDWVCEILSPSTVQVDKVRKMPIYAQNGVQHIWLVDPIARTLDAFRLQSGKWLLLGSYAESDSVRVEPFHEAEIHLGDLWLGGAATPPSSQSQ